ncbi:carbohydrate ABC transporter permease [Meiothermus granaticius]|uniref:Inner membrane ABC transporter permease protein YcjP n=1 Tax=Meiothermus granaticius NBRC 107808 TaxID=1227551 RepID=A0A399F962_9DEIN|nr:carbohydrate ABC transporter permease [Meiothermus granaticius]RIH93197.1 Inner membrane ABC transporter permease protein YcjP [Meiothermus granaticius NBRC 107808]GEM86604.1 sugar ABC transporter permease [Meiothermus granaticius NBRC 107808]
MRKTFAPLEALRWTFFVLVVVVFNFPLLFTAATSLKTTPQITAKVWLFAPTLEHYLKIFTDRSLDFPRYLLNSISISLGGTLIAVAVTLPAAYAIVRFGLGRGNLLPLITNLRAVPLIIFAIPFYLMFQTVGLLDTRTGLAIIAAVINVPLALILLVGFIQDFPPEIEEAARVDGAGTLGVFRHIIVPLAIPVLVAVSILSFIYSWNEYLFGLILTTKNAIPVTVGSALFITSWGVRWGEIAAAMTVSALPPLVLGMFGYRYLARALVAGAVKG